MVVAAGRPGRGTWQRGAERGLRGGVSEARSGAGAGNKLASLATNIDPRRVETGRTASSVGAQAALGLQAVTPELVRATLGYLADRVGGRLRAAGRAGRTVTVRVRFRDMRAVTRSLTSPGGISATTTLTDVAVELASAALADHPAEHHITLLAISVSQLIDQSVLQLELPLGVDDKHRAGTPAGAARWVADRSVDLIRTRFGRGSIGYAGVMFAKVGHAPDGFRELAEHQLPRD